MAKILAIDDKKDNLTVLSATLKNLIPDCNVITAQSGPEGIEKAKIESPDTILLDIKMPGMDGYEVCQKLKDDESTQYIPVIMISAILTGSQDLIKGLDIGADAYLAKPVDEQVLIAQVKTALRMKTAEDALRGQKELLEELVRKRTAELTNSNVQLKHEIDERKKTEEALQKSEKELNIRNQIAEIFLKAPDDKMYFEVLQVILEAIESPYGTFAYINGNGDRVVPALTRDIWVDCQIQDIEMVFPRERWKGIWGKCLINKETVSSSSPFRVPEGHVPMTRAMAVPIIHQGEAIGNFMVGNKPTDYNRKDEELLESIADHLAPILHARLQKNIQEEERKQAEKALREAYNIINRSHAVAFLWENAEGWPVEFVSDNVKDLFGYTADEFTSGKVSYAEIVHPDDMERVAEEISTFSNEKERTGFVHEPYRIIKKDGKVQWLDDKTYMRRDNKGHITHYEALVVDITDRMQADEALRESEEKYRSMMEAMNDMAYICSSDFHIEYMNPAMTKEIGREAVGESCHKMIHGLDEKCPWCVHEKVMRGGNISIEIVSPKDGKTFNISNSPIFHTNGSISNLSIFRDITETKKLEAQLRQAHKMESIGTLAGGVAHDFNNILFPIMGFAEMALDDLSKDSPTRNNIEEILQGTKRASELVKQILTFSRHTDKVLKPLKIQLVIREVLKLIKSTLPASIEINQYISNKCGLVMADPTQIHQVAMNLLTNTYHAMEAEGGKLDVTLKEVDLDVDDLKDLAMVPGTYVCLTVADTGIGMDQSVISRIFDPYFTTKQNGKGTGLGLAVVYGIVKEYGGDIRVYSELGKGTAFHVYLPVLQTQVETRESQVISPVVGGKERILLVDDEEPIVRMEKQMLERLGYHITVRTSSIEALEAFRAAPDKFDLVITDMTMPNMIGIQLAKKLLEIKSGIPIIICTGFSEIISEDNAKAMGICGYIMKPVIIRKLADKVRELLDQ